MTPLCSVHLNLHCFNRTTVKKIEYHLMVRSVLSEGQSLSREPEGELHTCSKGHVKRHVAEQPADDLSVFSVLEANRLDFSIINIYAHIYFHIYKSDTWI